MNDLAIRNILIRDIKKKHPSTEKTKNVIVQEMVLCKGYARADVALINGNMHGFEIKSDVDTLMRLNNQIDYYSKCFDFITVVASPKYVPSILSNYPDWLGVSVVRKGRTDFKIETVRRAIKNKNFDIIALMQLLWKDELIKIGNQLCPNLRLSYLPKRKIIDYLLPNCKKELLQRTVRETLKERTTWEVAEVV